MITVKELYSILRKVDGEVKTFICDGSGGNYIDLSIPMNMAAFGPLVVDELHATESGNFEIALLMSAVRVPEV